MPEVQPSSSTATILSLLILMGLIGYAIYNKIEDKKAPAVTTPFTTLAYLTINKQEKGQAPVYDLDIEYPEFAGLTSAKDESLNAHITDLIDAEVTSFKKSVADVGEAGIQPSSLYVRYKVKEANEKIVSIIFDNAVYISGAAHPNNFTATFNYRTDTGEHLTLASLFKKDSDYLAVIGPLARERLLGSPQLASVLSANWIDEGTAPTSENFSAFSLTSEGLTLHFNPYQVAAYAAGVISVTIPFSELEDLIDPAGPIPLFLN